MSDIVQFLRARLDEDERLALATGPDEYARRWAVRDSMWSCTVIDGNGDIVVYDEGAPTREEAEHIARQDPARTLRRVAAHRAILAEYEDITPCDCCGRRDREYAGAALTIVVKYLAGQWSDHPDYDQSWSVDRV